MARLRIEFRHGPSFPGEPPLDLRKLFRRSADEAPRAAPSLAQAIALHEAGNLDEARRMYEAMLREEPRHFDALHLLGVIESQQGRAARAVELIGKAIEANPRNALAWHNHGLAYMQLKDFAAAAESFTRAIESSPRFADAYSSRGRAQQEAGLLDRAIADFERAIALKPDLAPAHYNRARALQQAGRLEAAVESYGRAIALRPDLAEAFYNRAAALIDLGRSAEALADYDHAIRARPDFAEAHANRGLALMALRRPEAALESYDRALSLNPGNAPAWSNRGNALAALDQPELALASFEKAIECDRDFAEACVNQGHVLRKSGDPGAAIASFERAIALKPELGSAHFGKGAALAALNRPDEALESLRRALACAPRMDFLFGAVLQARLELCDWDGVEADIRELAERIARGERASSPFTLLAAIDSPALQRKAAVAFADARHPPNDALGNIPRRPKGARIPIGYFSADFRNHSVGFLTAGLFEMHDRDRFEVVGLSFGPDSDDPMRDRLAKAFDRFIDVRGRSDVEVAGLSREMGLDIAVDLGGYTEHARTGIFAARAAPVQVMYVGYLGTLGAPYYDYLIADPTLVPAASREHYVEKVAYVPSYQVNDSRRPIPRKRFTRGELGFPRDAFVFCCLNNTYKILPSVFDSWMRILGKVPDSVLTLYANHETARRNLRREAGRRGVAPERIFFSETLPWDDYVARFASFDLALDTTPYNAGTVASDALWAGLPVLTQVGESFASRIGASLLAAIRLPELVAGTPGEYEACAIELATDPALLATIRGKLEANRLTTPLFDTLSFTRHMEAIYQRMYDRYHAGLPPEDLGGDTAHGS